MVTQAEADGNPPRHVQGVSQRLAEAFGLALAPGQSKGECPFCHHKTFSIRRDDSIGKCFHSACLKWLGPATQADVTAGPTLASVLDMIFHDWHQVLLDLAKHPYPKDAYQYLTEERGIHSQVIEDAPIGVIPSSYDLAEKFQALFAAATQAVEEAKTAPKKPGRPTKDELTPQETAERATRDLHDSYEKLSSIVHGHHPGWVAFFFTDAKHRITAIKFRNPYTKSFMLWKPHRYLGLFGHGMFRPYGLPEHQEVNEQLIVVEGEINALQLQSLTVRWGEAVEKRAGYLYVGAVGGASGADAETIRRIARHPIVIYDHDEAGCGLVTALQAHMTLEACTTPPPQKDVDEYIRHFKKPLDAWEAVKGLIVAREKVYRQYSGTGVEFFDEKRFVPKRLADGLTERHAFCCIGDNLWRYDNGVYRRGAAPFVQHETQALLGELSLTQRVREVQQHIERATNLPIPELLEEQIPQYINVRNGRLHWPTLTLHPHSPDHFDLSQIPVAYDPHAKAPTFNDYLETALVEKELIQLAVEFLGYCLLPWARFEKFLVLFGEGSNGKSVFLDVISWLIGAENIAAIGLHELVEDRFAPADLVGKLVNLSAEIDTRAMRYSAALKALVTGDVRRVQRKFEHGFTFRNRAKFVFACNRLPPSTDKTHAFYRRLIIVPFTQRFVDRPKADGERKKDPTLRQRLQGELPGVLNLALEGLGRLMVRGHFLEPDPVKQAMWIYQHRNDTVLAFALRCLQPTPGARLPKEIVYDAYAAWCRCHHFEPRPNHRSYRASLLKAFPTLQETRPDPNGPWYWENLALVEAEGD